MGRRKKQVSVDVDRFSVMPTTEKIELFENFNELFHYELSRIPYSELKTDRKGKAEDIAQRHFEELGYEVYRSRVSDGYRVIGVEYYWQEHADKVSVADRARIDHLKKLLTSEEFEDFAYLAKEKSGTPDLLLIKDEKVSFVEVKFNYETVKFPTIYFWLKYGERWPTSILRVIR